MKDQLWVEKYRPKTLDEMVLEAGTRQLIDKFMAEKMIPHLLLSGHVGCGKTTISKILLSEMDCDSITLNASSDRGIDIIRQKVQRFAMMQSFKKLKIVLFDEADAITPDAQFALRNLMETYSSDTRFILTANYLTKIIEPIRSRCQALEFENMSRKHIRVFLEKVLKAENVTYDIDDVLVLIDTYYPDIRSMINNIQMYNMGGVWKLKGTEAFRSYESLLEFMKVGKLKEIRELTVDYIEAFRFLFDKIDVITEEYDVRVNLTLLVAEYMYRDMFTPDKQINFIACIVAMMDKMGVKIK